jgi:hypothetical protein
MVLKTFNLNEHVYAQFSRFCKSHGISMSKQVELFMESMLAKEKEAKAEYLARLERIRKGRFVPVESFPERYGLKA